MEKKYTNMERRGLPGGPNEMFTYVTGVFSTEGYRKDSPDVNNLFNVISSNSISMLENDGTPLKKGPIIGIDNLGNKKIMYPGGEYIFPGDQVFEIPMFQDGGEELPKAQNGIGDLIKFQKTLKKPTTTTAVKKEPVANSQAAQFAKNYNKDIRKVDQAHKDAGTKPLELTPEMTKEIQKQDLKDFKDFAFEFTGLPATARIYSNLRNDPIQFSKDVGNTLLDASTIVPELLYEGSNYLFGDGTFDLSDKTNVLGNPYGSGLNTAFDLLTAAGLFYGVGKFGQLTAKSFKPGFYPKPTKGLTSGAKTFKSEINWGNWNKDIPNNKSLMDEYLAIEESTKASGTWMKNPDGSAFKGTPEQFVQQQSQNFKKAFPNPVVDDAGNIQINYHGSGAKFNIFDPSKFYSGQFGKGVYTSPHKDKIIKSYANPSKNRTQKMVSKNNGDKPTSNLYELYINSKNPGNYDDIVDNSVSYIGDIRNYGKTADDFPTLAEWKNTNKEFLKQNAYLKTDEDILNFLNNQSIYNKGSNVRENFRPVLPEYDFLSIPSTPFKEGVTPFSNIMKSAVGNDGMFDMTNPDIYKALLPFIFGTGLASQKKGGEQLPKAQKRKFKPGGAFGPGDKLRRFLRNFDNTSIGFQPYSKLNPTAKSWTPKLTFNTVTGSPKKGFLDAAIEAGGDKGGFTGGLNARYFSPYLNKTGRGAKFDARIDGDFFYDKGYTGLNLSAGPNFHFGSKPDRELKRGRARFDVQPFNLRIGAGWDPQSITNQGSYGSNVLSSTTTGTSVASGNILDLGPDKNNFEMDWGYGASARGEWKPKAKWFPGTVFGEAAYNADLLGRNTGSISQETGNTYSYQGGVNPETGINDGTGTVIRSEIQNTFKPQHKFNVKLGVRVPLDDIKFNRRRSKTPDELDEEISVKERKPKPEKEPKPKKEPKPVEVDEWARHPRWLKYGGEELDLGNINPNSRYGKWLTEKVSSGKYTYDSKLNKLMPKAQPGIETKTNSLDPLDIKSRISNMIEGKTQEQAASEAEAARIKEAAEAERAKLKEATEAKLFKPEVKPEDPDKTSIGYYGDTFYLADNRKINAASGEPIVPTRDLFGGRYSRDVAEDIIKTSKNAKQDPYTMLAIALQETLLGKNDNNLGHIKDPMSDSMPEDYIYFFQNKQDELRNNEDFDYDNLSELLKIQAYNGLGTVYPHTEEDYHGHAMDYIYGVPLTGEGINMKENPLYGKRIIDLRDNVLKNNEAIKFLVDKYYNEDGGETDLYKVYSDFINGVYDDTNDYIRAEGVYDKLNRVHYKEAKESGMSIPNYIMTNVIKS